MGEGDLYAVVIGVSEYRNPEVPQPRFADKAAKDFADFLDTQKGLFRKIHSKRLIDGDATRQTVEKELIYGLQPAGRNSTVILYFTVHRYPPQGSPGSRWEPRT